MGGPAVTARAWQRHVAQSHVVLSSLNRPATEGLSAPPAGVTELSFAEFFGPVGDRGLEYTPKLRALDGKPVRLVGYMIREAERAPGMFRVVASPLTGETKGACAVDHAPPSAVHVFVADGATRLVPDRPGRHAFLGRLEIGPRVEADGRNSVVRLMLDDAAPAPPAASAGFDANANPGEP